MPPKGKRSAIRTSIRHTTLRITIFIIMTLNITTLDIQHNDSEQNYIQLDTKHSNIYHNDPSIIKLDAYLVFVLLIFT